MGNVGDVCFVEGKHRKHRGTLLYALSMLVLHRELYLQPFGLRTYSQAFAGSKLRPQKEQFEF